MKKAIIKLGYECNNNCLFCHAYSNRGIRSMSMDEAKKKILKAAGLGYGMLLLSGGEPTIREDILELSRFIRDNGLKFGLITNGRMLSHADLADRLMANGLVYCYVSLHGSREVHDKLTQSPGSFDQTIKGIGNLHNNPDIETIVNTVVNKRNLDILREIVNIIAQVCPNAKVKFSLVEHKGAAINGDLHPDMKDAAMKIKAAITHAETLGMKAAFDCIPLELMNGYEDRLDNLKTNGIEMMSEADEADFYPVD